MKYCVHCGNEILDEAVICPKCGCAVEGKTYDVTSTKETSTLKTASKILMIIGCVLNGFYLIPLCWCIPMTVSYCRKIKNGEPVSTGFKVCSLLFVSLIAGVLMLCDNSDN